MDPSPRPPLPAKVRGVLAGVLVAAFCAHLLTLQPGFFWNGDAAQLLVHSHNLVEGAPYADTGYIQNPERFLAPVAYPPGLPLLMAPVVAMLGYDAPHLNTALKIQMLLFLLGAAALLVYHLRTTLRTSLLVALALALSLQPTLWVQKHLMLTMLPFLFVSLLALTLYERASQPTSQAGRALGWGVLAGAMAWYAVLVRPSGIAVLLSFVAYDLVRHRRLSRVFAAAILGALLVFGAQHVLLDTGAGARIAATTSPDVEVERTGGSYLALAKQDLLRRLDTVPKQMLERTLGYTRQATVILANTGLPAPWGSTLRYGLSLLLGSLIIWGFVHRLFRGMTPLEPFAVLYLGTLLPWTFQQPWYIVPLIPLLYVYMAIGLEELWTRHAQTGRLVGALVGVSLVGVYLVHPAWSPPYVTSAQDRLVTTPEALQFYADVRTHTPPSATLLSTHFARPLMF
ncbi:MAG: hypothetical protein AAF970_19650, partial [Bacteroidota bacterium]